jgi:hypothetical protein
VNASSALNNIGRPVVAKAELRGEVSPKRQPRWLTELVATVLHGERGTAKVVADELPAPIAKVYRVADSNDADPLPAWWIPAVCRVTGSFAILDALEARVGRVAIPIPVPTTCAERADLVQFTAALMREVGEALSEIGSSIADGTINPVEHQRIQQQIRDAHAALASVDAIVAQKVAA